MSPTTSEIDVEFAALTAGLAGTDPADLPEILTDDEPQENDVPYEARHARRYCPWVDVAVPEREESLAVADAAQAAALDGYGGFLKSPTARHAHDGTAQAMLAWAAEELEAALEQRSPSRRRLRAVLEKMKAVL